MRYVCDLCDTVFAQLDSPRVTEERLGLNALTPEERADIISVDSNGFLVITSICDDCVELADADDALPSKGLIH